MLAEGAVIVASILLAFAIDRWWDGRRDAEVWQDYAIRLHTDLQQDTTTLAYLLSGLGRKEESLRALQALAAGTSQSMADSQVVEHLLRAEQYGWGQFAPSGTTFEDLRSTGNLRLIGDATLRATLVDYYEVWQFEQGRILSRASGFPEFVFKHVPIAFERSGTDDVVDENRAMDLRNVSTTGLVPFRNSILRQEETFQLIQHELNYTGFLRTALGRLLERAKAVLRAID